MACSKRMPPEGRFVIVAPEGGMVQDITYFWEDCPINGRPMWFTHSEECDPVSLSEFTYWMPLPAVPEEIEPTYEAIKAILPTANPDDYACCVGADMWNACRAAMLAQPVSHGYKLDGGWISCSEHLPESGQNVITLNNCGGVFGGYVFKKYTDGSYVFVDAEEEYREDDTITHWMPLPAAPEGGNDA
ncbi:MAG: DUF551 domain-containing protein [Sphingobacterium sp.]